MFKTLFSSFVLAAGIMIIYLGFTDVPKRIMEVSTKDILSLKKYLKTKKLLDLFTGICLISVGILSIVNLLSSTMIALFCAVIFILNRVIEPIIDNKFK